jgi:hypothetical protein
MGDVVAAAIGFLVALGVAFWIFRAEWRYMRFVSPAGALRRLQNTGEFSADIRGTGWAWDPAPTHSRYAGFGRVYGRCRVTYSLLSDDTVRLHVARPDGTEKTSEGPVPNYLRPGTPEAARARHRRRIIWAAATVYPLFGLIGFAVGYAAGQKYTTGERVGHGILGFFVGYLGVAIVLHVALVIFGASYLRHGSSRSNDPRS